MKAKGDVHLWYLQTVDKNEKRTHLSRRQRFCGLGQSVTDIFPLNPYVAGSEVNTDW